MPSYIADLDDPQASWYQATNDGGGWEVVRVEKPAVGDYLHSEFRHHVGGGAREVEEAIRAILAPFTGRAAVCRLDRRGTLDGWKHRFAKRPTPRPARPRCPTYGS